MRSKPFYILTIIFTLILSFSFESMVFAQGQQPDISAPYGVLIDYETGTVLYNKNAHEKAYPASTTKVMTAVMVLENANLDDKVTIDYDLYVDGSSMYLLKGESFTVRELLQALLIRSANDAAEALAIHIAGSVDSFVEKMNARAKELGAFNTNFTNPHGLPDTNHVTTAYDLAMISKHAMTFDLFRETVKTEMLILEPTEQTPETRYYRNTNKFLWGTGSANHMLYNGSYINIKYDIIDGLKTGYTGAAGNCLISSSFQNDHRLISVVLGAEGNHVYSDSRRLIDYGYENFKLISLTNHNLDSIHIPIRNGAQDFVALSILNDKLTVVPLGTEYTNIKESLYLNENIQAPVKQGDTLGKLIYTLDGDILGEVELIAQFNINEQPFFKKIFSLQKLLMGVLFLFVLWQIFVAYLRIQKRKRRKSFSYGKRRVPLYQFNKNVFK
ncbi:D-alanyl-D-alanine carboxypeptidase family protein [Alkaliphilus oremlandii]|uniref:serine-type D-Ala-D-Ala carboxypeptidase n=1 Tax=Alkaliphilus oremlandii (strain OhILAs) TaxID=350688 RepID=A8MHJ8_ALKOO|nr:D-alanyl-D-alanine carboxypeptidase family protein [Alkaliphilus oremlandii]ABW19280.1 Serine-type D-Ala-D-Ala carboxypeptidase [Alkaliphilus oremlandii OhILAs]